MQPNGVVADLRLGLRHGRRFRLPIGLDAIRAPRNSGVGRIGHRVPGCGLLITARKKTVLAKDSLQNGRAVFRGNSKATIATGALVPIGRRGRRHKTLIDIATANAGRANRRHVFAEVAEPVGRRLPRGLAENLRTRALGHGLGRAGALAAGLRAGGSVVVEGFGIGHSAATGRRIQFASLRNRTLAAPDFGLEAIEFRGILVDLLGLFVVEVPLFGVGSSKNCLRVSDKLFLPLTVLHDDSVH